jgi:superoxide dismutase, Fe-Mn family
MTVCLQRTAWRAWTHAALAMGLVLMLAAAPAHAQTFKQDPLPYAYAALEPHIDAMTMEIHYTRHHKAQADALNKLADENAELKSLTLEQILSQTQRFPASVRDNAGGHWNHDFFWRVMAPPAQAGAPSAVLARQIDADFGSMDKLREQFNQAAAQRFGSGWAWLIVKDRKLAITSTPNQDNPLMDVAEVRGTPVLGVDVWEHAYYLKYQNKRGDYLASWWKVVNWNEVNKRFEAAMR